MEIAQRTAATVFALSTFVAVRQRLLSFLIPLSITENFIKGASQIIYSNWTALQVCEHHRCVYAAYIVQCVVQSAV